MTKCHYCGDECDEEEYHLYDSITKNDWHTHVLRWFCSNRCIIDYAGCEDHKEDKEVEDD